MNVPTPISTYGFENPQFFEEPLQKTKRTVAEPSLAHDADEISSIKTRNSSELNSKTISFSGILVGSCNVGKTTILSKIMQDSQQKAIQRTIGTEVRARVSTLRNAKVVTQFWDFSGNASCCVLQPVFRASKFMWICYNVNERETLDEALRIHQEAQQHLSNNSCLFVLVGTKIDECTSKRHEKIVEGREIAQKHDMAFAVVSAKDNINVQELYDATIKSVTASLASNQNCWSSPWNPFYLTSVQNSAFTYKPLLSFSDLGITWDSKPKAPQRMKASCA